MKRGRATASALSRQVGNLLLASFFAIFTARYLGPYERGLLVIVLVVSQIGGQLGTLGLNQAVRVLPLKSSIPTALAQLRRFRLAVTVAASTIVVPLVLLTVSTIHGISLALLILVTAANAAMTAWSAIRKDLLHGRGHHTEAQWADIVQWATPNLLILALLVPVGNFKLSIAVLALSFGLVAQLLFLHLKLKALSVEGVATEESSGPLELRLRLSSFLGSSGQYAMMRVDKLVIAMILGPTVVAHYSVASTLGEISWVASLLLAQYASRLTLLKDERTLALARRANMAVIILWSLCATLIAPFIIPILFGSAYVEAISLVAPRALAAGACGLLYFELSALSASGKQRSSALIAWISVLATTFVLLVGSSATTLHSLLWLCALSITACAVWARLTSRR